VEKYVRLWQLAANSPDSGGELQFIFDEIIVKARFPIIVLNSDKEPVYWRNVPGIEPEDSTEVSRLELASIAGEMLEENGEFPLYFGDTYVNFLRYGDSEVINQLKVMPFVAIGIVLAFMIVAIIGFQNIRRSEERYIWVGMAKETAHQLGTPLSSLMGWLEVIGHDCDDKKEISVANRQGLAETLDNMKVDVQRLQRVAHRFSQIGSVPELKECNLNELIEEAVAYYRRRLPFEGKGVAIGFSGGNIPPVRLNAELFGWVLENLIKNGLEAVDPRQGRIDITTLLKPEQSRVLLEIADNGKGIGAAAARKIFRPGFTTKKRGWGMGLTLVKRIVEEYHVGRIALTKSRPGETVFEILLPIAGK